MYDIADIPTLPDQAQRLAEVTVDCYGQYEELAAMEVYFTDAVHYPFAAIWRDPDEPGHAVPVTVLGLATADERRGILLNVERDGKQRRILADQVWADDESSANAIVLNDYRYWVDDLNGLTPGFN